MPRSAVLSEAKELSNWKTRLVKKDEILPLRLSLGSEWQNSPKHNFLSAILGITFEIDNAELIQSKTGIPVVVIQYAGTEGFKIEDIMHTFTFLGKILNREKRAAELNKYIQQCIADLNKRTANSHKPTVYIGAISARGAHGITSSEADYHP